MGIVLAVLLAVAGVWVPWLALVAVAVASVAGVWALAIAGREFVRYRAERNEEARAVARAHTDHLREVHATHSSVMDVLSRRNESLRGELRAASVEAGELQGQVSRLRGDNEALRVTNDELASQVASRDAVLDELRAGHDAAEALEALQADVVALPRRRIMSSAPLGWASDEAETVIDLDLARLATPFVEDAVRRHAN